jgi:hypothetical protein
VLLKDWTPELIRKATTPIGMKNTIAKRKGKLPMVVWLLLTNRE